ncbi:MAG: tetratricopeptide repeat protein [Nitrospirota bacterium]
MNTNGASAVHAYAAAAVLLSLFVLAGCSLPRITILNDPLSAEEHVRLGRIYESQGKPGLASQQYRQAFKQDRKSVPALLLLGDLSYRTGDYAAAETAYQKAIVLRPDNGDIYNNLCWVYLEQHAVVEQALDLVHTALATTPEHRAYYLDTLGVVLLRLGRTAESIAALTEAVNLLPRDQAGHLAEAYVHLAKAYRTAGDAASAGEAERSAEQYHVLK